MTMQVRTQVGRNRSTRVSTSVGASRARMPERTSETRRSRTKLFTIVCAAGLLVSLVVWAEPMAYLKRIADRPITAISIEGQFHYLSQQKVQALVSERVTDNFLQLDMEALKQAMERNPWIDRVAISRQWPDRLVVRVEEQQPIARWGDGAFMNMRGDIIPVADNSLLKDLPLLHSSDKYADEVMHKYVQIARLLSPAELGLKEVHLDDTLSWTLELQDGMVIRIGRDEVFEKLQRLLDVFPRELAASSDQISRIDLRYDNGFAVAWKNTGLEQLAMAGGK